MIEVNFDKINRLSKQDKYSEILKSAEFFLKDENNLIANLSNIASLFKHGFDYYLWFGFYLYDSRKNNLVLGPFQGKLACTRIEIGRGVCGTAFQNKEAIIVDDVEKFPGHIFCDSSSRSEIVVPLIKDGNAIGVIDVDSSEYTAFDETDKKYLTKLSEMITGLF